MAKKNILIVSGHTNLGESVANQTILENLQKDLPEAEFDYLDQLYGKDFQIDIEREQAKLVQADIIVLQFPIFWYAMPSLMSRWMEEAFQHGFSHGRTGDKLKGKKLIASFTSGAPEELYHKDAAMGYEIEDFLPPIKAACGLCSMEFAGFVYTGGVSYQSRTDPEALAATKEKAGRHAARLITLIENL